MFPGKTTVSPVSNPKAAKTATAPSQHSPPGSHPLGATEQANPKEQKEGAFQGDADMLHESLHELLKHGHSNEHAGGTEDEKHTKMEEDQPPKEEVNISFMTKIASRRQETRRNACRSS